MKYLPVALFAATPALAHEGAHLHPHDGGMWLGIVAVLAGLALIVAKVRR